MSEPHITIQQYDEEIVALQLQLWAKERERTKLLRTHRQTYVGNLYRNKMEALSAWQVRSVGENGQLICTGVVVNGDDIEYYGSCAFNPGDFHDQPLPEAQARAAQDYLDQLSSLLNGLTTALAEPQP